MLRDARDVLHQGRDVPEDATIDSLQKVASDVSLCAAAGHREGIVDVSRSVRHRVRSRGAEFEVRRDSERLRGTFVGRSTGRRGGGLHGEVREQSRAAWRGNPGEG